MTRIASVLNERLPDRQSLASIDDIVRHESQWLSDLKAQAATSISSSKSDLAHLRAVLDSTTLHLARLRSGRERLLDATRTEETDASRVVARLDALQLKLSGLERTRGYLTTLVDIEQLSFNVVTHAATQAYKTALTSYEKLYDRWLETVGAEGTESGSKLDHMLSEALEKCYEDLKPKLVKRLANATNPIGWPSAPKMKQAASDPAGAKTYSEALTQLKESFVDLITLQRPRIPKPSSMLTSWSETTNPSSASTEPLLALKVLLDPVAMKFKYHFSGTRPTNRLDKPEWMFSHVLSTIRELSPFLESTVQPLLVNLRTLDAQIEMISGLCALLSDKIRTDMPRLLVQPNLMTHYVYEALSFDHLLGEEFGYRLGGVGTLFISNMDWFEAWLRVEKTLAKDALNASLDDPDAFVPIPLDNSVTTDVKPTKSSEEVLLLVEGLAARAQLLPDPVNRLPFVTDIALVLLDDYLSHIRDAAREVVDASVSTFSLLASDSVRLDDEGVVSVARWIGSVDHVITTLSDWEESLPFLELWQTMMTLDSRRMMSGETGVFGKTLVQYRDIRERLFVILHRGVLNVFTRALRGYERKRNWAQSFARNEESDLDDDDDASFLDPFLASLSPDISPELCRPLSILAHSFSLCCANLSSSSLTALVSSLESDIDARIVEGVVEKNHFGAEGAGQFEVDVKQGVVNGVFGRYLKRPEVAFKRLRACCQLLTLPVETMTELVDDDEGDSPDSAWQKLNLRGMSEDEARYILSRRTDW